MSSFLPCNHCLQGHHPNYHPKNPNRTQTETSMQAHMYPDLLKTAPTPFLSSRQKSQIQTLARHPRNYIFHTHSIHPKNQIGTSPRAPQKLILFSCVSTIPCSNGPRRRHDDDTATTRSILHCNLKFPSISSYPSTTMEFHHARRRHAFSVSIYKFPLSE